MTDPATRSVVVTGAGGGIGRAVCARLAREGFAVAAFDVSSAAAQATASALPREARAYEVDVCDAAALAAAVGRADAELAPVTCAVACAGVIENVPLLELPEDVWERTLDVNLKGTFFLFQAVGKIMTGAGREGALVALSSISARGPRPANAAYAASKAAVLNVVQSTALALAPAGIRVNGVVPGVIATEMTAHLHEERAREAGIEPAESLAAMIAKIPLGFAGTPEMVADVVAFLVSDAARYVTGQSLNVCGGIEMD